MAIKDMGPIMKPLTPELAAEFATMPKCRSERELRPALLAHLKRELEEGRFYSPSWAIAFLDGKCYRINGGHSSTTLAEANGHFPRGLMATIQQFKVDTEFELAELFDRFDHPVSSRTVRERVRSRVKIEDSLCELSVRSVQQILSGIQFAIDNGVKRSGSNMASLAHYHQPFILWAAEFTKDRKLDRKAVIACMFKSWSRWPEAATQFWSLVRDDSHPDNSNASRTLSRELFKEHTLGHGVQKKGREGALSPAQLHVKCIRGWNAWRTNQTTALRVLDGDTKNFPDLV